VTAERDATSLADSPPFRMTLEFPFAATHQLDRPPVPDGAPHPHEFVVRLVIDAQGLDRYGFLDGCDYDAVEDKFGGWLREQVQGQHLNELLAGDPDIDADSSAANPSIERLAWWFHRVAHRLGLTNVTQVWVSIKRTPTTWVRYSPSPIGPHGPEPQDGQP
jgi:6-pyruvoyl-tetrahydropterin synthase